MLDTLSIEKHGPGYFVKLLVFIPKTNNRNEMKPNIREGKEHFLNDLVYNLHAMFFLQCKRDISMEFENVGRIMRNYNSV